MSYYVIPSRFGSILDGLTQRLGRASDSVLKETVNSVVAFDTR
jgi:hypothetical protein